MPEIREYERTSTTLANVYVRPLVERYLERLEARLRAQGMTDASLYIMLSSGGTSTVETARRFPIRMIESGPAAGALAAAQYGALTDRPNLLSFDMGGTTAKACIIDNGEPLVSADFEVARVYRFKRGSGLPVRVPVIEMIEIGAGGGSIARADTLGLLKVGPDSAGRAAGPGLLRPRRHRADGDGRRPAAWLSRSGVLPRRQDATRRSGGGARARRTRRAARPFA